ncbi:hypothetical protein Ari01nite_71100 [Paractinoplanes rishiriensis]|uniref:Uncharacterized protein n=1 Tax=Paractinoplanes rishiriensis TaxID=1050105 RepID=A0A919K2R9_9ACTN|nr:hypothetical protein Ari01nite_71100 [Actinoplanes rishiriensis]
MDRRKTRIVTIDDLDTESGTEEICAQIRLGIPPVPPGNNRSNASGSAAERANPK